MERIRGRTIFVTGAGGFIGPVVISSLLERGARVRALVGSPGQPVRMLQSDALENATVDVTDESTLSWFAEGADIAVHMAGPSSVAGSFEDPVEYARVHVTGTIAVLQACYKAGIRRFVYMSSAEVYGRPQTPVVTENHPMLPRSPYGSAKAGAEHFIRAFTEMYLMSAVILRPFSVYGPGLSPQSLIGTILRMMESQQEIVLNDLRPVRDYCYVDDVADAVLRSCIADVQRVATINVGTGYGTSVFDLAQTILRISGRRLPVRDNPAGRRPGNSEIFMLLANNTRARQLLGWSPSVDLETGLTRTIEGMCAGGCT